MPAACRPKIAERNSDRQSSPLQAQPVGEMGKMRAIDRDAARGPISPVFSAVSESKIAHSKSFISRCNFFFIWLFAAFFFAFQILGVTAAPEDDAFAAATAAGALMAAAAGVLPDVEPMMIVAAAITGVAAVYGKKRGRPSKTVKAARAAAEAASAASGPKFIQMSIGLNSVPVSAHHRQKARLCLVSPVPAAVAPKAPPAPLPNMEDDADLLALKAVCKEQRNNYSESQKTAILAFFEKRGVSNSLSCKEIKDKLDVFVTESSISRWRKSERSQKLGVARGVSPCTAFEFEVTKMFIFSCSSFDKDGKAVSSVLLNITYTYLLSKRSNALS